MFIWSKNRRTLHTVFIGCLSLFVSLVFFDAAAVERGISSGQSGRQDIRVLIDISGSMKRTDPQNLRSPALRLFVSLLPEGTNTGVWTFGRWVNMLVPYGKVDKSWKKSAISAAGKINSAGLYTNIEDALRRATWDWNTPATGTRRSIILLTDGYVDIAKDDDKNKVSRGKILQDILPRLQKAGVAIHAIALSPDSDKRLLKQLTSATDGQFQTVETSDDLDRIFLHIFENVTQADSLPISNNRVKVDKSIHELTFLVFRKNEQDATTLSTPSGKTFNKSELPNNVQWYAEMRYDLVTVSKPEAGTWTINADIDPDNRVMVVTDLKLLSTKIPNSLSLGGKLTVEAHLEQQGKLISRREFLHFVSAYINQTTFNNDKNSKPYKIKLNDQGQGSDKTAHDGIFSAVLDKTLTAGEHEIELMLNGTTFKRYIRHQINIYSSPVSATADNDGAGHIRVSVIPYQNLIDSNAMRVLLTHTLPNGDIHEYKVPRKSTSEWYLEIDHNNLLGQHIIDFHIIGNTNDGESIDKILNSQTINIGNINNDIAKKNNNPVEDMVDSGKEDIAINWVMVSLRILVFNLLLAFIAFGFYKLWPIIFGILSPPPRKDFAND